MKKIIIINGPNLNLLGKREPSVYGSETFENFLTEMQEKYANLEVSYFQSNIEGELISKLHEVGRCAGERPRGAPRSGGLFSYCAEK